MRTILFLIPLLIFQYSFAQWNGNTMVNTPICAIPGLQVSTQICTDGSGGAMIAWTDYRNEAVSADVYVQRLDKDGKKMWATDGILALSTDVYDGVNEIISDGNGGAYITGISFNLSTSLRQVRIQHIDSNGVLRWNVLGLAPNANHNSDIKLLPVGNDIITVWKEVVNSNVEYIHVQKFNKDGLPQWTAAGVPLCLTQSWKNIESIISDEKNGAIILWNDARTAKDNRDLYIQSVTADGVIRWANNGTALCTAVKSQTNGRMLTDGKSGAYIVWGDQRYAGSTTTSLDNDVFGDHIDSAGKSKWGANGIIVSRERDYQSGPKIISDGGDGMLVVWTDYRNGTYDVPDRDIYAQHLDTNGVALWEATGVPVCKLNTHQDFFQIISDGAGGFITAWYDSRNADKDIYAQGLNADGSQKWATNGIVVANAAGNQQYAVLTVDGKGGAIISWVDSRNTSNSDDIYAARLFANSWTGAVSNEWENPLNWSNNKIPSANEDVSINAGKPNYPVISSNAVCKSIYAAPAASVTVNDSGTITIVQ